MTRPRAGPEATTVLAHSVFSIFKESSNGSLPSCDGWMHQISDSQPMYHNLYLSECADECVDVLLRFLSVH